MTDAEIRDLDAANAAKEEYERRAMLHFVREDHYRKRGKGQRAANAHWAATIAGHAAWAELRNPEPVAR